jgi:hypothetical protein
MLTDDQALAWMYNEAMDIVADMPTCIEDFFYGKHLPEGYSEVGQIIDQAAAAAQVLLNSIPDSQA